MNFILIVILSLILYFSQELLVAIVYYIFARLNMDYTSAPFLVLDLPPFIASILVFNITALHIKGSFFVSAKATTSY